MPLKTSELKAQVVLDCLLSEWIPCTVNRAFKKQTYYFVIIHSHIVAELQVSQLLFTYQSEDLITALHILPPKTGFRSVWTCSAKQGQNTMALTDAEHFQTENCLLLKIKQSRTDFSQSYVHKYASYSRVGPLVSTRRQCDSLLKD